jgi:hypothetical protein
VNQTFEWLSFVGKIYLKFWNRIVTVNEVIDLGVSCDLYEGSLNLKLYKINLKNT